MRTGCTPTLGHLRGMVFDDAALRQLDGFPFFDASKPFFMMLLNLCFHDSMTSVKNFLGKRSTFQTRKLRVIGQWRAP